MSSVSHAESGGSFYSLAPKWEKEASQGKTKKDAVDDGFKKALAGTGVSPLVPPPQPLHENLASVVAEGRVQEIELNQMMLLQSDSGIIKFLSTDEGIVALENTQGNELRILGAGIGSTFIHVWNGAGRNTFEIRVKPPTFRPSAYQNIQKDTYDKTRSFKVGFDNSRSAFYTGDKYREMTPASLDYTQNVTVAGDTPYGEFASNVQYQKSRQKLLLTDIHAELKDGKIGSFRNFNAELGNARVTPGLMVFPAARIRGGTLEHWDDRNRLRWNTFYGREESSVLGTITPGFLSDKVTKNSFLSGTTVDYQVNDAAKVKGGFFTAHGRDRTPGLHRRGVGAQADIKLGDHVVFVPETDFDNERFVQKHALLFNFEKLKIKNEYRDISKKFETLLGSPERHGELGYLLNASATPTDKLSLTGGVDIFKDRLIPNPDNPNYFNFHKDLRVTYIPWDLASFILTYTDYDDTGRLGPTKQRTIGGQFNQRFSLWNHPATFYSRYQVRGNRILNNATANYIDNQIVVGAQTEIFWGIVFSVEEEMNYLKEPNIRALSHPRATNYTFDYNHQMFDTPFYLDARLRIRDEEETESSNSFMTGEDSVEISGGLTYREYENMEIFLTGSFESFKAESLNATQSQRVEAQFYTGMRYVFDTGYRWSATADVQGYVFKDLNADGIKQDNEPGFGEMIVKTGSGQETKTDAQGFYSLKSVKGKTATITLDNAKIPFGFVPTGDVARQIEINQSKKIEVNFGITPRSEITGIVFNDLNENGRYDLNEKGVRKVKIELENGQTARTNSIGAFSFADVVAGEHTAKIVVTTLPEGYLPVTAPKKTFTVFEGLRFQLNFPLKASRVITGRVYKDTNKNGLMDADEVGVKDVEVRLGSLAVKTDEEGWYLFDNVKAGVYDLSAAGYKEKIQLTEEPATLSGKNIPVS